MESTRRELLADAGKLAAGATLLGAVPGWARQRPPLARSGSFAQSVGSGLTGPREVTLWTRLGDVEGKRRLRFEVARDPDFRHLVDAGSVISGPGRDHTAKATIKTRGLRADERYFYRFETAAGSSPVGRFLTLPPADSRRPLRIGFWTCQHYEAGFYASHAAMAADEDLDIVVCLGDYIYEGLGGVSSLPGRNDPTGGEDDEASNLEEYRAKYRLYQTDPELQALQESHACVIVWDDHEVVNNYWREGASADRVEGFAARRADAYRAWFEHLPVPRIRRGSTRIYRRLRIARLAELFLLDERQYRDAQPCGDSNLTPCPEADAPGRTLLGETQRAWLDRRLRASNARWKVLVNADMMMGLDQPAPGTPKFVDTWDGYAAEREELVSGWIRDEVSNVVVVTGDDHDNYAGLVTTSGRSDGAPGAVEFVVPSTTSDNTGELTGSAAGGAVSEANTRAANPHLVLVDQVRHGHCVLELDRREARMHFRHIADRTDRQSPTATTYSFRVPKGPPALEAL